MALKWRCVNDWIIVSSRVSWSVLVSVRVIRRELAVVGFKQAYCILPNARSDKCCIDTSTYQVFVYITTSSLIDGMCGYSLADWFKITFSFMVWFCWLYIPTYLILLKCIMSDMLYFYHEIFYSFELESCALLSYTFRIVCFVHIGIFRIGENYIQKVSCAMITKWKPSPILYWNASSTFFL